MTEGFFGLIGVFVGALITWFQSYYTNRQIESKNAKYLAIRVVCILDKFTEDCADVVKDDGLNFGQRTADGCLQPQIMIPEIPVFPDDIDWKSIDHELMYKILSFPSEIAAGNKIIDFTRNIAGPPDYEDWFDERRFHYASFGLHAEKLASELCREYNIKKKKYNDWDPKDDLARELDAAIQRRQKRLASYQTFIKKSST